MVEFDSRIEGVELELRALIGKVLSADAELLPSPVKFKIEERIKTIKGKDPIFDTSRSKVLSCPPEYADLRELEDIIVNKALWVKFQPRVINKETTVHKFSQIAEVRNCIRHSRQANIVVQKEGEAGILWFEQIFVITDFHS